MKVNCLICGKEQDVPPSRAKKYKTCSTTCMGKMNAEKYCGNVTSKCAVCEKEFRTKESHLERRKCCSKECDKRRRSKMYSGEGNPNFGNRGEECVAWRGGRRISNYGYALLRLPEHPSARPDGYVLEHRYIMSEYLGRLLKPNEHVHHIDGNRLNNSIENLQLIDPIDHIKLHAEERRKAKEGK